MKKICLVLAVVIVLLMNVNVFAIDDSNPQNIKNWTPYYTTKGGFTLSYEHKEGNTIVPEMYKIKNSFGYLYFYLKIEPNPKMRDEAQKDYEERFPKEFKNVNLNYTIVYERMDCKKETVETISEYAYSDKGELIVSFDYDPIPVAIRIKGSNYEKIPFDKNLIKQAKQEQDPLKKYGVEKEVGINQLEVNPYEFEGHTIAVVVQFQKMLSKSSAIFFSGYTNLSDSTGVPDQIIVTGIPKGIHFQSGFMAPRMMLALKGKGTIAGTNAYGARIKAPHFQWLGILSGEQKSAFEGQRDASRQDALRNAEQSRKIKLR
jgi:hypothetical protein